MTTENLKNKSLTRPVVKPTVKGALVSNEPKKAVDNPIKVSSRTLLSPQDLKEAQIKIDYLKSEIDLSLKKFIGKQKRNGRFGVVIKLLALALSAVVTVILGLNLEPIIYYNRVALALSALAGIMSGITAFFDFNELSIKYKDTVDKLEVLKVKVEYAELGIRFLPLNDVSDFKEDFVEILNDTYAFFQDARKEETDSTGKDTA